MNSTQYDGDNHYDIHPDKLHDVPGLFGYLDDEGDKISYQEFERHLAQERLKYCFAIAPIVTKLVAVVILLLVIVLLRNVPNFVPPGLFWMPYLFLVPAIILLVLRGSLQSFWMPIFVLLCCGGGLWFQYAGGPALMPLDFYHGGVVLSVVGFVVSALRKVVFS